MNIGNCALSNVSINYGAFQTCPEFQPTLTLIFSTILVIFFVLILIGLNIKTWKALVSTDDKKKEASK